MKAPNVPISVGAGSTQGREEPHAVHPAGDVVADFMCGENAEQGEGKRPTAGQKLRMVNDPGKGEEIRIHCAG